MEEDEYRSAYHAINQRRCVFEKSVLSRRAACVHAHRFCLADREGVTCQDEAAMAQCKSLLDTLRDKAGFALKLPRIDGPLPHAKEVKVQTGGLLGMQQQLCHDPARTDGQIADIHALIEQALSRFGGLDALPYTEIARSIVLFDGRGRRRRNRE